MKKALAVLLACCALLNLTKAQTTSQTTSTATAALAPVPYAVVSQGANSAVWQQETYEQAPDGSIVTNVHTYTELATGLNHLINGLWVASKEEIDVSPDGSSASATNGQHQVYFPGDIYNGMIKLVTPDGTVLQSQPIGLSYFDGSNSVLLAVVTNSTGAILPSGNQVIYTNAFVGLNADLLYTYTRAGFEQDVILREQPPDPTALGLNPQTTRLQVLTEFFNVPQPGVNATTLPTAAGSLEDDALSFGVMQMGRGKAFLIGGSTPSAGVNKQWLQLNGRQFLVEEVPLVSIAQAIDTLPPFISQTGAGIQSVASKNLILPPQRLVQGSPKTKFLAQAMPPSQGLVLDYVTMTSQTNWTFQGDTTYYISGTVNLSGTNTFEGDAVLKYTNGASLNMGSGSGLNWEATTYRPVIFTSWNDNSVGDSITGSSGNPTNYCANPALNFNTTPTFTISHFRIAGAAQAIGDYDSSLNFYDGQIVNCQIGISTIYTNINLRNLLFANVQSNFDGVVYGNVDVQNSTFAGSVYLNADLAFGGMSLENCILANVTNLTNSAAYAQATFTGTNNGFYNSPEFGTSAVTNTFYPFQAMGAGNYYLTNGCAFLTNGTTGIDPTLLAQLPTETVWPPVLYSNVTYSTNMTLSPQAARDTNAVPDLGYHYDPIDYLVDQLWVTNAVLTVTNGAVIACYNDSGVIITDGSSINSVGTPVIPNWFVRYSSSQEEPVSLSVSSSYPPSYAVAVNPYHVSVAPTGWFRFTKFACPAGGGDHLYDQQNNWTFTNLWIQDCEFWGGTSAYGGATNSVATLKNNLFARSIFTTSTTVGPGSYLCLTNNLFWGVSSVRIAPRGATGWSAYDNAFDSCGNITSGIGGITNNGYNAYLNCTNYLQPTNATDIFTNSLAYQGGPFGAFYQPTNSPLIHMGSTTADKVGLYHYTVTTNEVIEATNVVTIGYHYVATGTNGLPLDSNGNGIPDYIEDANGDGHDDPGDPGNWALAILVQPANLLANVGTSPTFSVTAGGIAPILYQWYFNSASQANATNTTLTLSNVQTNNAGNYYVIVTNNYGAVTSSVATLSVVLPPTVLITNPPNNSVFAGSPTNITIQATASDIAGTISQVQFFQGTNSLGIVTNAPYTLIWSNATSGNYALTAAATDNGLTATSPVVNITITPLFATNTIRLWLKADAIAGLTNNAPISSWADSSGWNNNATQSSGTQKPLYVTNALNGLPAVQFNPTNSQYFSLPLFMNVMTGAEAFVVLKTTTPLGSVGALWQLGNGAGWAVYPNSDGTIQDDLGSKTHYNIGVPAQPLNQYHVYNVAGQSNFWGAWINGLPLYQSTNNTFDYWSSPTLGQSSSSDSFAGDMAEVLIFNRNLTAGERRTVNEYLNSKYGLVATVPSTPTNLVADAISTNQISLTWSEALTNGGATQISIERSTNSTGPFAALATVADTSSYVDTNLAAGTTYYYEVQAINLTSWSPPSNVAQATTLTNGASLPFGNLALWLKADSGLTEIGTNTPVSFWADQSGNQNNATQPTGSAQPLWVAGALNGLPAVQFNPTNSQYFSLPHFMNVMTGAEAFVVLKTTTPWGSVGALWQLGNGAGWAVYPNSDGTIQDDLGSKTHYNIGVPAQPLNQYHVYNVAGQSNFWGAWINGLPLYQSTNNTFDYWSSPTLGQSGPSDYFAGDMAEVLVFNRALSAGERQTVNNYLNVKYGLVTVPPTPTNLTAAAISSNQISLAWNFTLGTSSTTFAIARSTTSNGVYSVVATVQNATSYVDTSLASGTTYYYEVAAENSAGTSAYSNLAWATTLTNGMSLPFGNLVLWLKADTGIEFQTTNDTVGTWYDQSAAGNNATQGTLANQPSFATNAVNGRPAVQFNGTTQFLNIPNPLNNTTGAEEFIVLQTASDPPANADALWEMGDYYLGVGCYYPKTSGAIVDNFGSANGEAAYSLGVPAQSLTQYSLYEVSAENGTWAAWLDGMLLFQTNNNAYGINGNSTVALGEITDYDGYGSYLAGNIAEILVFNRPLAPDERDAVGGYLNTKYGLAQFATNNVPPIAPTNLVSIGLAPYQLNLQWLPKGTNVASYHVERELGTNGGFQEIGAVPSYLTNFVDTTACSTNVYFYRVRAHNFFGDSYSALISPPTVSMTNWPGTILENTTNLIGGQAADANGTISSVGFFVGAAGDEVLIGTSTSPPYAANWVPSMEGTWSLSAMATDSLGNSQFSMPVTVTVYLDSDGDGIPDYLDVLNGNNPLNPWNPPSGDTNSIPPTIFLYVPANATLLP